MKARAFIALGMALAAMSARAEFFDGNKLYERLTSSKIGEYGMALGYIMGVADTMQEISHCAPANATAGQLSDMVKQYLERQPSMRTTTADVIVIHVLKTAWPCKKGTGT